MSLRHRKYRNSLQKYQDAIEKQLNCDFMASEYLSQNQLTAKSIDQYSKLLNSLIVTKNNKLQKYQTLKETFQQYSNGTCKQNDPNEKDDLNNDNRGNNTQSLNLYQKIQQQITTELQVKSTLQRETTQMKKSLDLLKGDIRHLVTRNQSTNIIQSKTSKLKVIAEDQLQKVSFASLKDKQELKTRSEMQKKFKKNIHNLATIENSTLKKLKHNYIDMVVKRKHINNRLDRIQKIGLSMNDVGEKEKLTDDKKRKILQSSQYIIKLINFIKKMPFDGQRQFPFEDDEIQAYENYQIKSLSHIQEFLVAEFQKISLQIEKKIINYNMKTQKYEQLIPKLQSLEEQILLIKQNKTIQISSYFVIHQKAEKQYKKKLEKFSQLLNVIFILLEFIEKSLLKSVVPQKIIKKPTQNNSQFYIPRFYPISSKTHSQVLNVKVSQKNDLNPNNSSEYLSLINKNYISELMKINLILFKECIDKEFEEIDVGIFQSLQFDIKRWLKEINWKSDDKKMLEVPTTSQQQKKQRTSKFRKSNLKLRQSRMSVLIIPRTKKQIEEEQKKQIIAQDSYLLEIHNKLLKGNRSQSRQDRSFNAFQPGFRKKTIKPIQQFKSTGISLHQKVKTNKQIKDKHVSQHVENRAQRVHLLKKADNDYYKMLKSTFKMEKQNTKENYLFLRNFKRAKFSPRNKIFQQKRFELALSMSFAKSKSEIMKKNTQNQPKNRIKFLKNKNLQKRVSKLNDSYQSLCSSYDGSKQLRSANPRVSSFIDQLKRSENENAKKKKLFKQSKQSILKTKFSTQIKEILTLI